MVCPKFILHTNRIHSILTLQLHILAFSKQKNNIPKHFVLTGNDTIQQHQMSVKLQNWNVTEN